jgi:hypothetical protein
MSISVGRYVRGWGCIQVHDEESGDISEIHVVIGDVLPSGNFVHFGHILSTCCDCKPRVEIDKMMPIVIHRHDA